MGATIMININALRKNQDYYFSIQDFKFCFFIEFMTFSSQKYSGYFNAFLFGVVLLHLSIQSSGSHIVFNDIRQAICAQSELDDNFNDNISLLK